MRAESLVLGAPRGVHPSSRPSWRAGAWSMLLVTVWAGAICGGDPPARPAPSPRTESAPLTVIVVHGTYDGEAFWPTVQRGEATFASELVAGLRERGQDAEVRPFLWRTSVDHRQRMEAARSLAQLLDAPALRGRRVALVGHSHGGNVSLAAVGLAHRDVETVVCLATPHVHLSLRRRDGPRRLPVYCSPEARRRIGTLLNVWADADPVVESYASLRKGITEAQALELTMGWQRVEGYPRLADDGGPVREALSDWLGLSRGTNLSTDPRLAIANANLPLAAEGEGLALHHAVHSRRLGRVLGEALASHDHRDLKRTVLPRDADGGEPLNVASHHHAARELAARPAPGWIVRQYSIRTVDKRRVSDGNFWDGKSRSWPDMYLSFGCGPDERTRRSTTPFAGVQEDRRELCLLLPGERLRIEALDRDVLDFDERLGEWRLSPAEFPRGVKLTTADVECLVVWEPGRY